MAPTIIDSHIHVGRWNYEHYRHITCAITSKDSALTSISPVDQVLAECGIDGAVLLPTDACDNQGILDELRAYRGARKYWLFSWCNPGDDSLAWIRTHLDHISGLKIHASLDRCEGSVGNPAYEPFLELAAERHLPVLVHCGRWQKMASYLSVLETARRHPEIDFIAAHLGGDMDSLKIEAPRALRRMELRNVWFDISATREFWTIEMAVREIGADRLLFSSDYPVMHPRMSLASVQALQLSDAEAQKIYAGNILELIEGTHRGNASRRER